MWGSASRSHRAHRRVWDHQEETAFGPAAGLEIVDTLISEPSLKGYHLLLAVRGDFLAKLGRFDEASGELERAASLTRNAREREMLLQRAAVRARASVTNDRKES